MAKKPRYITTAIAYTIRQATYPGNTYEIVLAETSIAFKSIWGYDVQFTERFLG